MSDLQLDSGAEVLQGLHAISQLKFIHLAALDDAIADDPAKAKAAVELAQSLVTEDAVFELGEFGEFKGPEGLAELLAMPVPWKQTVHSVSNPIANIDGDTANVRWILHVVTIYDDAEPGDAYAYHQDEYRRGPDGWKLARQQLSIVAGP